MAGDGLTIKLENAAALDRILSKEFRVSTSTRIVNQSLNKAAADVRKRVKNAAPVAKKNTTGFKLDSRNTKKGQLKRSVKSGLRRRARLPRDVFMSAVFIQDTKGGAKSNADGWFAPFVIDRHSPNAFGYMGGNNFLKRAVKSSSGSFRRIIGDQLIEKIIKERQKLIDKLR